MSVTYVKLEKREADIPEARARITASVADFSKISGICPTYVYKLIKRGEIKSVCIGRKRVIILESYLEFINRLQSDGLKDG